MSALLINGQIADFAFECLLHEVLVEGELDIVQNRLHSVGAPQVAAYLREVGLNELQNAGALVDRATLEQLLAEVIPITVNHNEGQLAANVMQHEFHEGGVGLRKLLLQVTRTGLGTGQRDHAVF